VAEGFLGAPYRGRQDHARAGLLGLVQIALTACGMACPRDSDMQEQALGTAVDAADFAPRRPGLLERPRRNRPRSRQPFACQAFHMAVADRAIAEAVARIRAAGGEITGVRRIVK